VTPTQVSIVQDSFKKVVPIAATAADLFYDHLFTIAPEVRRLFPDDLRQQKTKLIAMLATAVGNLHQIEQIIPAVKELARRHVSYGVRVDHFEPVGEALLWALEQGLGSDFTSPVKAAWTQAYITLSRAMKDEVAQAEAHSAELPSAA
jgi:hemoglobin-like flavoprotein